ncbi:hypothetical protein HED60_13205 [Planctomycetales bacterium ZRK34]|nr:hypothetical protein HED60_13205 [Planctomycetales bacterium ZRK34]
MKKTKSQWRHIVITSLILIVGGLGFMAIDLFTRPNDPYYWSIVASPAVIAGVMNLLSSRCRYFILRIQWQRIHNWIDSLEDHELAILLEPQYERVKDECKNKCRDRYPKLKFSWMDEPPVFYRDLDTWYARLPIAIAVNDATIVMGYGIAELVYIQWFGRDVILNKVPVGASSEELDCKDG